MSTDEAPGRLHAFGQGPGCFAALPAVNQRAILGMHRLAGNQAVVQALWGGEPKGLRASATFGTFYPTNGEPTEPTMVVQRFFNIPVNARNQLAPGRTTYGTFALPRDTITPQVDVYNERYRQALAANVPAATFSQLSIELLARMRAIALSLSDWVSNNNGSPLLAVATVLAAEANHLVGYLSRPTYLLKIFLNNHGPARLLTLVRDLHTTCDGALFEFLSQTDWVAKAEAKGAVLPKIIDQYGGTFGGPYFAAEPKLRAPKSYVFVGDNYIRQWLDNGQLGNLVATIEHEYVHVKQSHSRSFLSKADRKRTGVGLPEWLVEVPAYWGEIRRIPRLVAAEKVDLLPEDHTIREAVYNVVGLIEGNLDARHKYGPELVQAKGIVGYMEVDRIRPAGAVLKALDPYLYRKRGFQALPRLSQEELRAVRRRFTSEESLKKQSEYEEIS